MWDKSNNTNTGGMMIIHIYVEKMTGINERDYKEFS